MANAGNGRELTQRAEILLDVLDCINRDVYDAFETYWIFGGDLDDFLRDAKETFETSFGYLPLGNDEPEESGEAAKNRQVRELIDALREVAASATERRGRAAAERRTSLDAPAKEKRPLKGMDRLRKAHRPTADKLEPITGRPYTPPTTPEGRDAEQDSLDAHYAKEVLGKLSRIVRRAANLDCLDIQGADKRTGEYFKEAHRCYLYGFPVACAALCRAIVESALQDRVDFKLSRQGPGAPRRADLDGAPNGLELLIKQARGLGLLSDCGKTCADDVRQAGNWAVHPADFEKFEQRYGTEGVGGVVLRTRTVLLELYDGVGCRQH
jgi:hypothetical protein